MTASPVLISVLGLAAAALLAPTGPIGAHGPLLVATAITLGASLLARIGGTRAPAPVKKR